MHKKNNFLYVLIIEMRLDNFHYAYMIMQLCVKVSVHDSVKCRASFQKILVHKSESLDSDVLTLIAVLKEVIL